MDRYYRARRISVKKFAVTIFVISIVLVAAAFGRRQPAEPVEPLVANAWFISDVEYMLYVLENNFALFHVAYWGHSADIPAIVDNVIQTLAASEAITVYEFDELLAEAFLPLLSVGHFRVNVRSPDDEYMEMAYLLLSDKAAAEETLLRISRILGVETASLLAAIIINGDIAELAYNLKLLTYLEYVVENSHMQMKVLEYGRVAYMSVSSFMHFTEEDIIQIRDFYLEIGQFEHLILDFRGNGGGCLRPFINYILIPLWNEPIAIESYILTLTGEYSRQFLTSPLREHRLGLLERFFLLDTELRPISTIIEESYLPLLNISDRPYYGFRAVVRINRSRIQRFENVNFNGCIWILIDDGVGSAAHVSSWIAKESGFATLVGDTTFGAWGGQRVTVTLPYSGTHFYMDLFNVLDSRGYAIEAGIEPHIFNRPGLCALKTALALIDEMHTP